MKYGGCVKFSVDRPNARVTGTPRLLARIEVASCSIGYHKLHSPRNEKDTGD